MKDLLEQKEAARKIMEQQIPNIKMESSDVTLVVLFFVLVFIFCIFYL